jgi:hypothetical protein
MLTLSQLIAEQIVAFSVYQPVAAQPASCIPVDACCASLSSDLKKGNTMPEKKMYPFLGKHFTGQTVEVEGIAEPFSQYKLSDGTTVKVKMIIVDAVRLDTHDDLGNPVYQFQFQQIIAAVSPDELKRKAH